MGKNSHRPNDTRQTRLKISLYFFSVCYKSRVLFLHRRKCPDLVHRGFVFTVSLQDQGRFLLLRREPGQGWPGGRGARAALGCCRGWPRSLPRWLNRSNPPNHCSVPWFALLGSWVAGAGRWGEQERCWVPQVGAVRLPAPLGRGNLRCRVPHGGAPSPPRASPCTLVWLHNAARAGARFASVTAAARCRMPWVPILTSPTSSGVYSARHF